MEKRQTVIYSIANGNTVNSLVARQVWTAEKWPEQSVAGYNRLCAFHHDGDVMVLGHDATRQAADIYQVRAGGSGLDHQGKTDLHQAYDIVASFYVGGKPHFLAYNRDMGKIDFYKVAGDLSLAHVYSYERTYGNTTLGFTTVVPYDYRGDMFFLAYNADTGQAAVYQLAVTSETALHVKEVWRKSWAAGWTGFAFFKMGGENFFLKTNTRYNNVNIDHMVDNAAEGSHPVGTHLPLSLDVDAVAAFEFNHFPCFLTYRDTGKTTFNRFHGDCRGWTEEAVFSSLENAVALLPFRLGEESYLQVY